MAIRAACEGLRGFGRRISFWLKAPVDAGLGRYLSITR